MFRNTTERLSRQLDMQTTSKQSNCYRSSNTYHQSTNSSSSHHQQIPATVNQQITTGQPTIPTHARYHHKIKEMTNQRNKIKSKPTQNSNKTDMNNPKRHLKTNNKTKNKTLKMVQININGIQNSLIELHQQLIVQSIDIALIQETKLHPETPDPTIPDYTAYRQDRPIKTKTEEETEEGNSGKNQTTKSKTKNKNNINGGGLITCQK